MTTVNGDQSPKGEGSPSNPAHNGSTLTLCSASAKATTQRGGHWDRLYQRAESLMLGVGRDSFLSGLLAKYLEFLPNMPGMSEADNVLHWITRFMDGTRGTAPARDAVKYLCRSHWDLATAIKRWCDVANFSYMGVETCSDSEEGDDSSEEDEVAKLNPNVDRSPALKGQVRPDKFLIVIHQPGGKSDKRNEYQAYDQGRSFDWNQSDHIRALNRWRSQILRAARISFHEAEIEWLYQMHRSFLQAARDRGERVSWNKIKWDDITVDFNEYFEGTVLPGDPTPRPARTKASLTTERYRVKRITDLAGLTPKQSTSKSPKKKEEQAALKDEEAGDTDGEVAGKEEEDDKDDEDQEEEEDLDNGEHDEDEEEDDNDDDNNDNNTHNDDDADATEEEPIPHQPPPSKPPQHSSPSSRGNHSKTGRGGKSFSPSPRGTR